MNALDQASAIVAIPAATLIVMRDCPAGPPDLLIVERAKTLAFAGGALVFPGGRVDLGDRDMAATMGGDCRDDTAARIAAIRETIEEAGLPVGFHPLPRHAMLAAMRAGLHAGVGFNKLLNEHGIRLALAELTPFARWRPVHRLDRVFDTRFYLAVLPAGSIEASVDATETVGLRWASAAAVLAENAAGRATLLIPTRLTLERLALYRSSMEALADAAAYPIETISPWVEEHDGDRWVCIPDNLGFPTTRQPLSSATRG